VWLRLFVGNVIVNLRTRTHGAQLRRDAVKSRRGKFGRKRVWS